MRFDSVRVDAQMMVMMSIGHNVCVVVYRQDRPFFCFCLLFGTPSNKNSIALLCTRISVFFFVSLLFLSFFLSFFIYVLFFFVFDVFSTFSTLVRFFSYRRHHRCRFRPFICCFCFAP